MRISKVRVKNFRNLTNVEVSLSNVTSIIGNNNSGKSNLLRAITLPLLSDDLGSGTKSLGWTDIGDVAKDIFYQYIVDHIDDFKNKSIKIEDFSNVVPYVLVRIDWEVLPDEEYAMQDFNCNGPDEIRIDYALQYEFRCKDIKDLLNHIFSVTKMINSEDDIKDFKYNFLPIEKFGYTIFIPGKDQGVSFDKLRSFNYNSIAAERDDFSSNNSKIGSKSLIQILNKKLDTESMVQIEKQYTDFFEDIKRLSKMEEILNWQEFSEVANVKDFFSKISILPNMPPMNALLNGVKLGYEDLSLSSQGLGYRNLILQLVLVNAMLESSDSLLSLLTIEEPEAHLCYRNEQLLMSFFSSIEQGKKNIQLIYSTHSTNFINKIGLENIVLMNNGEAHSFCDTFTQEELAYLSKNPNLDLFKMFYAKNLILVEGISEELLIKAYLKNKPKIINDIEVISFHKGFRKIIDLWLKINGDTENKLGIVRDFDDQQNAQDEHEAYNRYSNVFVRTTIGYTLENDLVNTEGNYDILRKYFATEQGWEDVNSKEDLIEEWKGAKADVMFRFCQDLSSEELQGITLPTHINEILNQMLSVTNGGEE